MRKALPLLACAALALVACQEESSSGPPVAAHANLSVTLSGQQVPRGATVDIALTVLNDGGMELMVQAPNGCGPDFAAATSGVTIWRYLDTVVCPSGMQTYRLQPGESRTFQGAWNQKTSQGANVGAGFYAITGAVFATDGARIDSPPANLTVL